MSLSSAPLADSSALMAFFALIFVSNFWRMPAFSVRWFASTCGGRRGFAGGRAVLLSRALYVGVKHNAAGPGRWPVLSVSFSPYWVISRVMISHRTLRGSGGTPPSPIQKVGSGPI